MALLERLCPRRDENPGPWKFCPGPDTFQAGRCSYCGGLAPEEFMRRVEEGEKVIPTDKSYKVYLSHGHEKFYYQHLSDEQKRRFVELLNEHKVRIDYPGYFYVRPYFVAGPPLSTVLKKGVSK